MALSWVGKTNYLTRPVKKTVLSSLLLVALSLGSAYADTDKTILLTQSVKSDIILKHFGASQAEMKTLNPGLFESTGQTIQAGTQIMLPEAILQAPSLKPADFYQTAAKQPALPPQQTGSLPELPNGQPAPAAENEPTAVVASTAVQAAQFNWENLTSDEIENKIKNMATDELENEVKSKIISPLNQYIEEKLNTFGYAKAQFQVDREGEFKISQFSLLIPIAENESNLGFTQFNVTEQQDDILIHGGLGYRYTTPNYLLGFNTFVDHNTNNYHTRMSVGAELGMDYILASTNYYLPISDWKSSDLLTGFESRPAQGYDIRLQGYLPSYPHLGANAVFEQYFGDEVALFNESKRQTNPISATIGLDYTPIPLITADTSYQLGESGQNELRFGLSMNLRLGQDISAQLDPANVDAMRKYPLNRYEIVDRNYEMVMEYREIPLSHELTIMPLTKLTAQTVYPLRLTYKNNKFPLSEIVGFEQTGGCQSPLIIKNEANSNGLNGWTIEASKWFNQPTCDTYYISAMAKDSQGNTVRSPALEVIVGNSSLQSQIMVKENIKPINDTYLIQADAKDSYQLDINIVDSNGEKIIFADFDTFKNAIQTNQNGYLSLLDSNNVSWLEEQSVILNESYVDGTYSLILKGAQTSNELRLMLNFGHYGQYSAKLKFGTGQVIMDEVTVNANTVNFSYYLENIRQETVPAVDNQLPEHTWQVFNANTDITSDVIFSEIYDSNASRYILTAQIPTMAARTALIGTYALKGDFLSYGKIEKPFTIQTDSQYIVSVNLQNATPINSNLTQNFAGNNSTFKITAQVYDMNNQLIANPTGEWLLYETNAAGITIGEELHTDKRIRILNEVYDPQTNQFEIELTGNQFINLDVQFMLPTGEMSEVVSLRFLRDPKNISVMLLHTGPDGLAPATDFINPSIDQYYQIKVIDQTTASPIDVTAYYASQVKWFYQDPSIGKITEVERCQGKYMFSTQVSNNDNVDARSRLTNSEQGLRLSAQINNEYDAAYPEAILRCPDGKYVIE